MSQQSFCGNPVAFARQPAPDVNEVSLAVASPESLVRELVPHLENLRADVVLHCQELAGVVAGEVERHGSRQQRQQKLKASEQAVNAALATELISQLAPHIETVLTKQEERMMQVAAREVQTLAGRLSEQFSDSITEAWRQGAQQHQTEILQGIKSEADVQHEKIKESMEKNSFLHDLRSKEIASVAKNEFEGLCSKFLGSMQEASQGKASTLLQSGITSMTNTVKHEIGTVKTQFAEVLKLELESSSDLGSKALLSDAQAREMRLLEELQKVSVAVGNDFQTCERAVERLSQAAQARDERLTQAADARDAKLEQATETSDKLTSERLVQLKGQLSEAIDVRHDDAMKTLQDLGTVVKQSADAAEQQRTDALAEAARSSDGLLRAVQDVKTTLETVGGQAASEAARTENELLPTLHALREKIAGVGALCEGFQQEQKAHKGEALDAIKDSRSAMIEAIGKTDDRLEKAQKALTQNLQAVEMADRKISQSESALNEFRKIDLQELKDYAKLASDKMTLLEAKMDQSELLDAIQKMDPKELVSNINKVGTAIEGLESNLSTADILDAIQQFDPATIIDELRNRDPKGDVAEVMTVVRGLQSSFDTTTKEITSIQCSVSTIGSKVEQSVADIAELKAKANETNVLDAIDALPSKADSADLAENIEKLESLLRTLSQSESMQKLTDSIQHLESNMSDSFSKIAEKQSDVSSTRDTTETDEMVEELVNDVKKLSQQLSQHSSDIGSKMASSVEILESISTSLPEQFKPVIDGFQDIKQSIGVIAQEKNDIQPLVLEVSKVREYCEAIHTWLQHLRGSMEQWGMEHIHKDMESVTKWLESVHTVLREAANTTTVSSAAKQV